MRFDSYIDIYLTPEKEIFSGVNRYGNYFLNANNVLNNSHKTFNQNREGFINALEFLGVSDKKIQNKYLRGENEIYEWEI